MSTNRTRNAIVAMGLVVFASAGLAFPFYMASSRSKPVIDSSKPLPPQATFRGPYINTGSRDVGPDYRSYPKNEEDHMSNFDQGNLVGLQENVES